MERKSGAQDCGEHQSVGGLTACAWTERGGDVDILVLQSSRDFICHYLAYAVEVGTESQRVVLDADVA